MRLSLTSGRDPSVDSEDDDEEVRCVAPDQTRPHAATPSRRVEAGDPASHEAAVEAFRRELDEGMLASVSHADGSAEVVRELPLDAELVVLRRPIAGG